MLNRYRPVIRVISVILVIRVIERSFGSFSHSFIFNIVTNGLTHNIRMIYRSASQTMIW